jgi:DNA polymerase-1
MIVIDIETYPITADCVAPAPICLQVLINGDTEIIPAWEPYFAEFFLGLYATGETIVGHNVAYDLLCIARHYPRTLEHIWGLYASDRVSDTMIRQRLIDIAIGDDRLGLSLADVASIYGLTKNSDDPWRLRYSELWGVPVTQWPEGATGYALHDVEVTAAVWEAQASRYVSPDEARQCRAAWWLQHIGDYGISTDPDRIADLERQTQAQYDLDAALLQGCGLMRANGTRDLKAAREYAQSIGVGKRTKKDAISLSADTCDSSGDPILSAYARTASAKGQIKKIDDLKLGIDSKIRPRYGVLKVSGRTSSIRGKTVPEGGASNSLQMQNVPTKLGIRECYIPDRGECIIAIDYSQMELCTWAQICLWALGQSDMADALNSGKDPHLMLGAKILGISYSEAVERRADADVDNARSSSKPANFGFPVGMGAPRFVENCRANWGINITVDEAKSLKNDWESTWSEAPKYLKWVNNHPKVAGKIRLKHFISERVCSGLTFAEACNYHFQGLAADAAKNAGYMLVREIETGQLRRWKLWNFVHDEFLLRGPVDECDSAAKTIKYLVEEGARAFVPDVPPKAEPVAMVRWTKKAKATYDNSGKLIPYIGG